MITKRTLFLTLVLVLALVATGVAQQPGQPSVNRLQQIISYLASDALEGRRTGTPGANDAAHYIAGEFSLLGLRPAIQMAGAARTRGEIRARYLQPFPYVSKVELGSKNALTITTAAVSDLPNGILKQTLRVGEDWMPLGFSTNGTIESDALIFAGYGISAPELKYDDYAGGNAKGRVAIIFAGTPDGDNPHGQFQQAGQTRFKVAAARAAGARALVIISNENNLNDDRLSHPSYDNAGEAGLPAIVISRKAAANVLGSERLASLEKSAAAKTLELPIPKKIELSVDVVRRESPSFNVVGILPGTDLKLKNEAIVIGAHYDHLGLGGEGSLAPREGEIHHGADDNASGTAGVLELARIFSAQKPRRTIVFIAFSGEEEGLIGSNYYVNHPVVPLANTVAMINMDMIGREAQKKLIVGGVGTAQDWRAMIDAKNVVPTAAASLNVAGVDSANVAVNLPVNVNVNGQPIIAAPGKNFELTMTEDGFGPSDHSSFYAKQVPVLFFWTGTHNDYHKPSDTYEKINYEGEARILSFVASIVREIDRSDARPKFTVAKSDSQGRSTGFRVYLGTIPNYADSSDGLTLDGVRDESPAAKAGLKAGDRIVKMAGRDVKNVYDYTQVLSEMKAGQEYDVELIRGGQRMTLKITPEARK
jgi:aminopeptidase YwaD